MQNGHKSKNSDDKYGYPATRRTLLNRLKDLDDQTSWHEFFNTYWKLIYNSAVKAGLTHSEAEDAVQETIMTVSRKIQDLKYDPALGSFKGWLLNTTRWRVNDQFRQRKPDHHASGAFQDDPSRTPMIERIPDNFNWDEHWEREWRKNLMDAAIERVKHKVGPKQFQIFDLYVLKEWPVSKVVESLDVSSAQVYLAKHRISAKVKKEIKRLKKNLI